MTYYIVTGRIPHNDEDTADVVEGAESVDQAVDFFKRTMLKNGEATEYEDGEPVVYINYVIRCESETPPKIVQGVQP
jgi:hypothetical protein